MRNFTLLLVILLYTSINFAQKQIPGIQIQETNLLISAEVDSPTRVTFKITPLGENKAIDTFIITSFNNLTFKAMALNQLRSLNNSISENFKSEIYKYSDQDIEKLDSIGSQNGIKALEKAKDNVDFLFNYFDNQINILYKYDTEPVAGVLYFKKDNIEIQHFEKMAYEIYFNNMKRNYHKLIKELFEKRLELVKGNQNDRSAIEDKLVTDIINYFKKSKKDYLYELSGLEDSETTNSETTEPEITDSETTGDSKDQNSNDKMMARQFLDDFKPLIEDFRSYNRNKRMEIIYKKILSNRNQIIFNQIRRPIDELKFNQNNLKDYIKIDTLTKQVASYIDSINKIEKEKKNIKAEINRIGEELKKIEDSKIDKNEVENQIKKLEKEIETTKKELEEIYKEYKIESSDDISTAAIEFKNLVDDKSTEEEPIPEEDLKKEINKRIDYYFLKSKLSSNDKIKNKVDINGTDTSDTDSVKNDLAKRKIDLNNKKKQLDDRILKYNTLRVKLEKDLIKLTSIHKSDKALSKRIKEVSSQIENGRSYIESRIEEFPLWKLKPIEIQLDINDGFIEHIVIEGERGDPKLNISSLKVLKSADLSPPNKQLKFTNNYPLGFSSSKDFDDFKEHKVSVYVGKHKRYEMRLGDLFPNYIQTLQNDRLNFSPKDQAVTIFTDQGENYRELKKESSSKLLQVKVYSDFVGLNSSDPNGTFQLELEKYIPIYTKRKSGLAYERYFGRGSNIGFFNYIKPEFRWSRPGDKDDNDKLELQSINAFNGSESITLPYATHLDLMRFESLSVGADLNLFVFDFPTAKWRMEVNASGRYGVTDVVNSDDTNVDDSNLTVNTWRFYPEFIFRLRPEERYGANLSLRPIRFNSVTDGFSNISSANAFTTTLMDDEQWLHQIEINAHFSPKGNKDNRFFFRYRYTNNASWEYNGFSEIQVGYSMSLKF